MSNIRLRPIPLPLAFYPSCAIALARSATLKISIECSKAKRKLPILLHNEVNVMLNQIAVTRYDSLIMWASWDTTTSLGGMRKTSSSLWMPVIAVTHEGQFCKVFAWEAQLRATLSALPEHSWALLNTPKHFWRVLLSGSWLRHAQCKLSGSCWA